MNPQTPNPQPVDVEAAAEAIYDLMRANDPEGSRYPWAPGGNSDKQQEARRYAAAALASTRPQPVEGDVEAQARELLRELAGYNCSPIDAIPEHLQQSDVQYIDTALAAVQHEETGETANG